MTDPNKLQDISLVSEPSSERLNERQKIDYREERRRCLEWLLLEGKDPYWKS